jgi:hypothetical protein
VRYDKEESVMRPTSGAGPGRIGAMDTSERSTPSPPDAQAPVCADCRYAQTFPILPRTRCLSQLSPLHGEILLAGQSACEHFHERTMPDPSPRTL